MNRLAIAALLLAAATVRADPPLAPEHTITCKPLHASIHLGSRFQVKCDTAWTNPTTVNGVPVAWFAVSTADANQVAQAQAAANTAIIAGKKVEIIFRTASSENPSGCGGDCRKLSAIAVLN